MSLPPKPQGSFSKVDLTYEIIYNPKFVPARSPTSSVKTVIEGSLTTHQLRVGMPEYGAAQFYFLDEPSNIVWGLLDGERTVREIVLEASTSSKVSTPEDAYGALLFFAETGALKAVQDPVPWKRVRFASAFRAQVALVKDSTKMLSYVHRIIRPFLRESVFWATMIIALAGAVIYAPRFNSIFNDRVTFQVFGSTVVGFLFYNFVVLGPVILIHELFHGLALLHYSGRSGEVGTGWFYFGPAFYVDVTSYWQLPRKQRIMIMWAGNLSTVLIGSLLVLSQLFIPYSPTINTEINVAVFWCFYGTLWNLAPPFETDGYYILADILRIPNLRTEGFSYLKNRILRAFGRKMEEPDGLTDRRRRVLLGYAIFSIVALGYIGYQAARFAVYMGLDAVSWETRLSGSLSGGGLSPIALIIGLTSIFYFGLTVSGYSVLIGNQVKKSAVRGLPFEAVQDRTLSLFFYIPPRVPSTAISKFEGKMRKAARHTTSNFSIRKVGPLFITKLKLGSTNLPLAEIKLHFRHVEERFLKPYQHMIYRASIHGHLTSLRVGEQSSTDLFFQMAGMVPVAERSETRQVLRELLSREQRIVRYLLNSSFGATWAVEIPPGQQLEVLEGLLSRILVEDITMTNLAEETEDFKKNIIYGLDTIAELAASSTALRDEILARPEKNQLVPLFEPVRGRITFLGRTESIEKSLDQTGLIFVVQAWSGFCDNLLANTNLTLYTIAQSLPPLPEDLNSIRDGELQALSLLLPRLTSLEAEIHRVSSRLRDAVHPSMARLKDLKPRFAAEAMPRTNLFNSILAANLENLQSVPTRLKDTTKLSTTCLKWAGQAEASLTTTLEERRLRYTKKRTNFLRNYVPIGLLLLVLLGASFFIENSSLRLSLTIGVLGLEAIFLAQFYLLWRSMYRVSRHPSTLFLQLLTPIYALTIALGSLVAQGDIMNPLEVMEKKEEDPPPLTSAGKA